MEGNKSEYLVDQYLFDTEEEYQLALEEKKKIQYIDEHTDYRVAENVAVLYKRLVDSAMFQTPIGYGYLERLRDFLVRGGAKAENIPPIPIKKKVVADSRKQLIKSNNQLKEELQKAKRKGWIWIAVSIGLMVAVIAMFVVAFTSDNPNVLNYENSILNKYSAWEQELTERENVVREKERTLEIDE